MDKGKKSVSAKNTRIRFVENGVSGNSNRQGFAFALQLMQIESAREAMRIFGEKLLIYFYVLTYVHVGYIPGGCTDGYYKDRTIVCLSSTISTRKLQCKRNFVRTVLLRRARACVCDCTFYFFANKEPEYLQKLNFPGAWLTRR